MTKCARRLRPEHSTRSNARPFSQSGASISTRTPDYDAAEQNLRVVRLCGGMGQSIYFCDPAGNVVELAPPTLWSGWLGVLTCIFMRLAAKAIDIYFRWRYDSHKRGKILEIDSGSVSGFGRRLAFLR